MGDKAPQATCTRSEAFVDVVILTPETVCFVGVRTENLSGLIYRFSAGAQFHAEEDLLI